MRMACVSNSECGADQFCQKAVGDCQGTGTCAARPQMCNMLYMPVRTCSGGTASNQCFAWSQGENIASIEATVKPLLSPAPASCQENQECAEAEFCQKAIGDCKGSGRCVVRPQLCTMEYAPVKTCSGGTASNKCMAWSQGENVAAVGEVMAADPVVITDPTTPEPVTCTQNADCGEGMFCQTAIGNCDGKGQCASQPQFCTKEYMPVRTCSGTTVGNKCMAYAQGENIAAVEVVEPLTPSGCQENAQCGQGQFCQKADCKGTGQCTPIPTQCPVYFRAPDPVTGCDGRQYYDTCRAWQHGINVASSQVTPTPLPPTPVPVPPTPRPQNPSTQRPTNPQGQCHVNAQCGEGQFCQKKIGDCKGWGQCVATDSIITPRYIRKPDPVMGCDRRQYADEFAAWRAGVNVAYRFPTQIPLKTSKK
ncbi:hypothetical protein PAPYR_11152 [Paratrimastix pyriformis]|uniref:Kazal-like domain-containing protein n=1 Tax=Paratrimastix pyriformis TaxID=342808 RepID=A0ABQ8U8B0_9EUKA|nr:hypothetical protein PAPYR_11152 [Paratrimastix pyriformis]